MIREFRVDSVDPDHTWQHVMAIYTGIRSEVMNSGMAQNHFDELGAIFASIFSAMKNHLIKAGAD